MTANRASLARGLKKAAGMPYREAAFCVDFVVEAIAAETAKGRRVELRGLGSFSVTRARVKNCPSSLSGSVVIPAHGKVTFRPSASLKRAVWGAAPKAGPEGVSQ
jgi:nucleoid DNA-binding protein